MFRVYVKNQGSPLLEFLGYFSIEDITKMKPALRKKRFRIYLGEV